MISILTGTAGLNVCAENLENAKLLCLELGGGGGRGGFS